MNLGMKFSVLLEEAVQLSSSIDRLPNEVPKHPKILLNIIEAWELSDSDIESLSKELLAETQEIEVLEKARALVQERLKQDLEGEIRVRKAVKDNLKVELLQGMVYEALRIWRHLQMH
jgi:hypothetical protein